MKKIKGIDGKACWKGYRYAGTENGKDKCVKMEKGGAVQGCGCPYGMEIGPNKVL
tara:strand:- start:45 stop:209 length:165 start_codon:yes stop_codon:yes gene_type:complete